MKAKKLCAVLVAGALAVGAFSVLAACKDDEKNDFVEDTRIWYAVGNDTKGTMKANSWDPTNSSIAFERDTTVKDENVFTLSLDIYAGDMTKGYSFKFLYKTSADETFSDVNAELWPRQVGIHNFSTMEGYEGEGVESIIKIDGEKVFYTAEDNGDTGSNLALAKGQEGTYKFTLKTKSNEDTDPVITVERTAKIQVSHDMTVKGDMNVFGAGQAIPLSENIDGENITWTKQLDITAADLCRDADGKLVKKSEGTPEYAALQIVNDIDNKGYIDENQKTVEIEGAYEKGDKVKVNLLKEGKYNISFNQKENKLTITEIAYQMYFIGGMNNWKQADEDYPLTVDASGMIWTGKLTVTEDTEMKLFNSKGLNDSDKYIPGGLGNIKLTAGDWFFKFDANTNEVKYEKFEYYLVGGYTDPTWGDGLAAEKCSKLTASEDGATYSITLDLKAGTEVKVVYGVALSGANHSSWGWANGGNLKPEADGKYTITYTVEGKTMSIAAAAE